MMPDARLPWFLGLASLLLPSHASAQEPPDTFRLNPIVVTATRLAQPRAAVPAAITVLEGETLRTQGIRFVADALRLVPGANLVQLGSRGGLTSLFMRGGESDYVQVMVDGIVLNEPGGAFDIGQLTMDNVDRIEVVRGPASVLYGSDAVTGVVHVITRAGSGPPHLTASASIGTEPKRNGAADTCPGYPAVTCPSDAELGSSASHAFDFSLQGGTERVQYALSGSRLASDGTYAFNNDYSNRALSGRTRVLAGDRLDITVVGRWTDAVFHYPTDGAGRLVDRNQFRSTESVAAGVDVRLAISSNVDAHLGISSHDGGFLTEDRADGPADTLGSWESTNDVAILRRKANAFTNVRVSETATLTVGAEIESQDGQNAFTSDGQFGPFEATSDDDRTNRAAFLQFVTAPRSPLSFTIGARIDDNNRFGSFTTWRAGANVQLGSGTLLRGAAGSAFKEPTFFENYAEGFTIGNEALEPEESRSWEIAFEQRLLAGRAVVIATWFDQRFTNLIQYVATPAVAGSPNYVNLGEARSAGLELEGRGYLGSTSLAASWTWLDTEVLDEGTGSDNLFQLGESLIRRPAQSLTLSASSPLGNRINVFTTAVHVGERDDLDFLDDFTGQRVVMPAYTVVNLGLEARPLRSFDLGLGVRIDNVLGEAYRQAANFPAAGRSLHVTARTGIGF